MRPFLRFFSSIWLGISLIAAILLYAAVGSAVPAFRQTFELTEFAYFNHWIFAALIGLFCLNLTVATVRRIPFNLRNAGVLTVHTGLLVLCAGSVVYFGRKVEGDLWLDAPRIRVISADRLKTNPDQAVIGAFVAVKGKTWQTNAPMLGGAYNIEVADVRHEGMTTASSVKLKVQVGSEPQRDIELTQSSDPQSRFAKLNDRVLIALTPARVTDNFFDDTTPILKVAHGEHVETYELPMLPYYSERFVSDVEQIEDLDNKQITSNRTTPVSPIEKWRMPIVLDDPGRSASADWPIRLEIDGYLPYAQLEPHATSGGTETTPIANVRLNGGGEPLEQWLVAQMPARSYMESPSGPRVEFAWLADKNDLGPAYTHSLPGQQVLEVRVKDKNIRREYAVTPGQVIDVEGTGYKLTVEQLQPSWPLMTAEYKDAHTPIALVWVESPTAKFQRSVLQRFPHLNQDRDRAGKKISDKSALVDENLELFYTDASTDHFMIVAGEKLAPTLIHTAPGGQRKMQVIKPGETYQANPNLSLTLADFIEKPLFVSKPTVIPTRNRRSLGDVKRSESLIRVKLASRDGTWNKHVWVPFSHYNNSTMLDVHEPTVVNDVPGMGTIQLLYGRQERPLPTRVTLEQLKTDFYPGRQQPSEWTSYFRFDDRSTNTVRLAKAFLNNTARIGDWTLFQSQAAGDHESWTVLGVGNRQGVLTMLAGCTLIAMGMIFAFAIKPIIVRRYKQRIQAAAVSRQEEAAMTNSESSSSHKRQTLSATRMLLLFIIIAAGARPLAAQNTQSPASDLAAIQSQLDLKTLGALVLQHQWRYATVDSWARDAIKTMYGKTTLFNLDPIAASMEMMFNAASYHAEPIVYVKDKALIKDLTAYPVKVSDAQRREMFTSGRVSYDFLRMPEVSNRIEQLSGDMLKKKAMDRLSSAVSYYESLASTFTIVPNPTGSKDTPWSSPAAVMNSSMRESTGLDAKQAAELTGIVSQLGKTWRARDVAGINTAISQLSDLLPRLAPQGVYLPLEKREAEVSYRRMNLLWWSWLVYIFAFFIAIYAVATSYGWVRIVGLVFLIAAVVLHGLDIGLRWYVIGRIPVANMYEAIVSSAFSGVVFALLLELFSRKRVYLLAAGLLGFFSLALPELLPDKIDDKLVTMMPILDDIMLRIHTVLIISSYAVITLAYGVANCYLFVSAKRNREPAAIATIGAQIGAIACMLMFRFGWLGESDMAFLYAIVPTVVGGILLSLGITSLRAQPALTPALAGIGGHTYTPAQISELNNSSGAATNPNPKIEKSKSADILQEFDLSHRVLLYTAMVALFVGLVLGAVWADYSWGRPWGWDPKEVFALNTWLVYAILIHVRFVTKKRALWAAILSVIGFAAMQFNWWVVNFYIVGLHSYA